MSGIIKIGERGHLIHTFTGLIHLTRMRSQSRASHGVLLHACKIHISIFHRRRSLHTAPVAGTDRFRALNASTAYTVHPMQPVLGRKCARASKEMTLYDVLSIVSIWLINQASSGIDALIRQYPMIFPNLMLGRLLADGSGRMSSVKRFLW